MRGPVRGPVRFGTVARAGVLAHLLADLQPGYEDKVVHQLDGLTSDLARVRDEFEDKLEEEATARVGLDNKVREHARVAIYYRGEQDKKYDKVRDLTMCASRRALEAQAKVDAQE